MTRTNNLIDLEGPRNVGEFGENGEVGKKWRFWRNFAKVVDEMIRANKLTQLEGPHNVGENGEFENGDFSKICQTKGCQRNDKSE